MINFCALVQVMLAGSTLHPDLNSSSSYVEATKAVSEQCQKQQEQAKKDEEEKAKKKSK